MQTLLLRVLEESNSSESHPILHADCTASAASNRRSPAVISIDVDNEQDDKTLIIAEWLRRSGEASKPFDIQRKVSAPLTMRGDVRLARYELP
jgi:hypothetical protein